MTDIIIYGTTMKERAILEYKGIRYMPLDNSYYPIKDIKLLVDVIPENVIKLLERPRKITNGCAVLVEALDEELNTTMSR